MKLITTNVLSPAQTLKCQMSHRGNTTWQTPDKYPGDGHARDWLSQKDTTENLANSLSLSLSLYKNDQGNNYVKPRN